MKLAWPVILFAIPGICGCLLILSSGILLFLSESDPNVVLAIVASLAFAGTLSWIVGVIIASHRASRTGLNMIMAVVSFVGVILLIAMTLGSFKSFSDFEHIRETHKSYVTQEQR